MATKPANAPMTKEEVLRILAEDPEAAMHLDISDDLLMELQKELNPYGQIVGPSYNEENAQAVALSITNLREDYLRRFMMTGMVGFLFRMHREWETPSEDRRWATEKPKGETKPFDVETLERRVGALQTSINMLKDAQRLADEANAAAKKFDEEECVFTEQEMEAADKDEPSEAGDATEDGVKIRKVKTVIAKAQELFKKARDASGTVEGLRFVTTVQMRNFGIDADLRLPETVKTARKHGNAARIINDHPNWTRGIIPKGQMEVPQKVAKHIIKTFLKNFFEFDPDAHVRKAYDEAVIDVARRNVAGFSEQVKYDVFDPDRLPLTVLLQTPPTPTAGEDKKALDAIRTSKSLEDRQRDYNTLCRLMQHSHLADAARYMLTGGTEDPDRVERWRRILMPESMQAQCAEIIKTIPPQDTFHRFKYYLDVNFEQLRSAVNCIYHEKPDLDYAIQLMKYFKGTAKDVQEESEKFRNENQHDVLTDIKVVNFGGWTILGEFEKNREKIDIYNDQADLIKRILDRHEQDAKFGKLLMRQRVHKEKAKNIAEAGPDAPGLAQYKSHNPTNAPAGLSDEERLRLERAKGNLKAARELAHIDSLEATVKDLQDTAKLRELTSDESYTLKRTLEDLEKAREMLEVPDGAVQVDVYHVDAGKGTMRKEKMFTRAVEPGGQNEDFDLSAKNARREELMRSIAEKAKAATEVNPLDYYPAASRELAKKAFAEGKAAPPLAPFAQDFLHEELKKERAETERIVQAATGGEAAAASAGGEAAALPSSGAPSMEEALASVVNAAFDEVEK